MKKKFTKVKLRQISQSEMFLMRQMFWEKQTLGKAQNYLSLESNPIFFLRHTCQSMNEVSLEDIENVNTQTCVGKVIRLVCLAGIYKSCLVTVSTSFRGESSPVCCLNCRTLFLIAPCILNRPIARQLWEDFQMLYSTFIPPVLKPLLRCFPSLWKSSQMVSERHSCAY